MFAPELVGKLHRRTNGAISLRHMTIFSQLAGWVGGEIAERAMMSSSYHPLSRQPTTQL
jgi:hypothetical protein